MATSDASSAAPRVPPTAPPTTAVLSFGHSLSVLSPLDNGGAVDVPCEEVGFEAVGLTLLTTPCVISFPISRFTIASELEQQFLRSSEALQQYWPGLHGRILYTFAFWPAAELTNATWQLVLYFVLPVCLLYVQSGQIFAHEADLPDLSVHPLE